MSQQNAAPLPEPGKPRLLDQVRHRCRLRHLALSTEQTYVAWIRRFILFHDKRHPLEMGGAEVSAFLTHLAVNARVAASTQNQALSALLFLYRQVLERDFGWLEDVVRANKAKRLPVVFTPEEAASIIGGLRGVRWLMGMQLYGGVELPYALARKYPQAAREWGWQYVYPAKRPSVDPRRRVRRRHHLDPSFLQKAIHAAIYTHVLKLNGFAVRSPADKLGPLMPTRLNA